MPLVPAYETMGPPFEAKRASGYIFEDTLEIGTNGNFGPLDLTGATVHFHLSDTSFITKIDAAATIVDEQGGQVKYTATGTELTLAVGNYLAEWKVTFAGGQTETIPGGRTYRPVILGTALGT